MGTVIRLKFSSDPSIAPAQVINTNYVTNVPDKPKHKGEAITDPNDLVRISEAFISKGKFRDNLLFVIGINAGLRGGELRSLKYGHFINPDGTFKNEVTFVEEKTSKKNKETGELIKGKIKTRTIYPNQAILDAIILYVGDREINLDDWLFPSESNNKGAGGMEVDSISRVLKATINKELGIKANASSHCLRKTCAYHAQATFEKMYPGRDSIAFLQAFLGHADIRSTMSYVGITERNIADVTCSLNLGMKSKMNSDRKEEAGSKFA